VVEHCVLCEEEAEFYIIYVSLESLSKSENTKICMKKMNDVPLFQVAKYTFEIENCS
jgi:hypothetical protein